MVGTRVPDEWHQQIKAIAQTTGRREAEVVREALASYLGRHDPNSIKSEIASLQDRVAALESWRKKLSG